MWNKSFQEIGLPAGYGFKQLLFSPAAKALVIQAQSAASNWRPERLYVRKLNSDRYEPIGQPDDLTSQDYPFLHSSKPLLAYNSMQHHFSMDAQDEERHSADWESLRLYDLESSVEVNCMNAENLTLPPGIVRGWISRLVAFCDSGLFVQAGLSKDGSRMDYVVAEIDFLNHILTPLAALPATFI